MGVVGQCLLDLLHLLEVASLLERARLEGTLHDPAAGAACEPFMGRARVMGCFVAARKNFALYFFFGSSKELYLSLPPRRPEVLTRERCVESPLMLARRSRSLDCS